MIFKNYKIVITALCLVPVLGHAGWYTDAKKAVSNVASSIYSGVGAVKDAIVQGAGELKCSNIPRANVGPWRSRYYPSNWTPPNLYSSSGSLQDFSYAGYGQGMQAYPNLAAGYRAFDVSQYGADRSGRSDSTSAIIKAYQAFLQSGVQGYLYFPNGLYKVDGQLEFAGKTILKGQSIEGVQIFLTKPTPSPSGVTAALVMGGVDYGSQTFPVQGTSQKFSDSITIPKASAVNVGDDVAIGWEINDSFISAFGMSGIWPKFGPTDIFQRTVKAKRISGAYAYLTLDEPLRYTVSAKYKAYVRKKNYSAVNCGIQDLSITTARDTKIAYATLGQAAIDFSNVKNCYIKNVRSVPSWENIGALTSRKHLMNSGIFIENSRNVTVDSVTLEKSQNRSNGGNGYLFLVARSNDILIKNSRGNLGRHAFVATGWGNSNLVLSRFTSEESGGWESDTQRNTIGSLSKLSDFHKYMLFGALIEDSDLKDGWTIGNRGTISDGAGHTGMDTVFWNNRGKDDCSYLMSFQYAEGYVIGTSNIKVDNRIDSKRNQILDILMAGNQRQGTAPDDIIEGENAGHALVPASLFNDQIAKRKARGGK